MKVLTPEQRDDLFASLGLGDPLFIPKDPVEACLLGFKRGLAFAKDAARDEEPYTRPWSLGHKHAQGGEG